MRGIVHAARGEPHLAGNGVRAQLAPKQEDVGLRAAGEEARGWGVSGGEGGEGGGRRAVGLGLSSVLQRPLTHRWMA